MVSDLKVYSAMPILGGLKLDRPEALLQVGELPDDENSVIRDNIIGRIKGYVKTWPDAFYFPPNRIDQFSQNNGNNHVMVGTQGDIWYKTGTAPWTCLTPTYTTGTIDVTSGSPNIHGNGGTTWLTEAKAGDQILVDGDTDWYEVQSVTDDDDIVLTANYAGTTQIGANYTLRQLFVGTDIDHWDSEYTTLVTNDDISVWCNGMNDTIYWDGSSATMQPLIGAPKGKFVREYENHLFIGRLDTNPQWIQCSDLGDPTNWATGDASIIQLVQTPDWVSGFAILRRMLVVLKERSIWGVTYLGTGEFIYRTEKLVSGIGCIAPKTIIEKETEVIFLGPDNIYSFNGIDVVPIGDSVKPILNNLSPQYKPYSCAILIEENKEIRFAVPYGGSITNNLELIYNYDLKTWTTSNFTIKSYGYYNLYEDYTWDTMPWDAWEDIPWERWDTIALLANSPINVAGLYDNYVYSLDASLSKDGTPFSGYIMSAPISMGNATMAKRLLMVELWTITESSGTLDMYIQSFDGNSQAWSGPYTIDLTENDQKQRVYVDLTGTEFKFKFEGNNQFRIIGFVCYYQDKSQRKTEA